VAREVTANGITVELYHFADTERLAANGQTVDGAPHALDTSVKAIEQYSSLFGAYPYSRLVVVQGDFPDGMEFSGLVYVSTTWFYDYEGGADNYLTVITVHEVSHQWWYSLVGSDAAITPWLDESLATYSEYMFFEEFYPELKNWWWSFRVAWYNPQGAVDSTVYEFENVRDYIDAVYLRGVQMLQNVRDDIGNEAFFDLLAAYVNAAQGQIATPELFWSLLTEEQLEATAATRAEFLKQP
jgi:aminopeptidase N